MSSKSQGWIVCTWTLLIVLVLFPECEAGYRIFTDTQGRKIEAEIITKSDNLVRVRTQQGREHSIKLETLSEADREFVGQWVDPSSQEALAKTDLSDVMKARGFVGVPFETRDNHLFIDFTIGGHKATFLLDSGAMTSVVTPAAAAELKLEVRPTAAVVQGVGGGAEVKGEATARDCRFEDSDDSTKIGLVVMDLPITGTEGLLGSDFFREHHALLDYRGEMLWLFVEP